MSTTRLDTPFLEGGIRSTHFFNGRLLSREDLQREQEAERAMHERLGRALGIGIVRGLEVTARSIGGSSVTDPVVTVRAGLAVNRRGQTVALDRDVDVSLLKPAAAPAGSTARGGFDDCQPPDSTVYVTGTGVYLLAVAPTSQKQGLAVVSGLGNAGAPCNAKEVVEGVQFRLLQVTGFSSAELADAARLRNVAAYRCFFAEGAGLEAARDPFGARTPPTPVLSALTDCDVPLALLHWTATGGLRFVDIWSVRRRLSRAPLAGQLPAGADDAPLALGEAILFQFQDHIESLRTFPALRASDAFRWLPPVGLLPLGGSPGALGVNAAVFFSGFTTRGPMFIEGSRVRPFLQLAITAPPIRVDAEQPGELVWLYQVRENQQPVDGAVPRQPYLIFALGRLPCQVDPRFDVSRWSFANYALDGGLIVR